MTWQGKDPTVDPPLIPPPPQKKTYTRHTHTFFLAEERNSARNVDGAKVSMLADELLYLLHREGGDVMQF